MQFGVDAVELVGMARQRAALDALLQPAPLERRRFVEAGWRVVVELQQFRRTVAAVGKVHAAVQMRMTFQPGRANHVVVRRRDAQSIKQRFAAHHAVDQVHAHLVQFGGRVFQIIFDLRERELVVRAFVPVGLVVDGVEHETEALGCLFPVGALGAVDLFHGQLLERPELLPQPPHPLRALDWLPKPPREVEEATFTGLLLVLS